MDHRSIGFGVRLMIGAFGLLVAIVPTREVSAQVLRAPAVPYRASTGTPSSIPFRFPSQIGLHRDWADGFQDFLGAVAGHQEILDQGRQDHRVSGYAAAERVSLRSEAARMNSVVCRQYTSITELSGPGGSVVRSDLKPASQGPTVGIDTSNSRRRPTTDDLDAGYGRSLNTLRSDRELCEAPPVRMSPVVGPLSSLDVRSPVPAWTPALTPPPLPRLEIPWSRGPSLLNASPGPWDASRYPLGVDTTSLTRAIPWSQGPSLFNASPGPRDVSRSRFSLGVDIRLGRDTAK